MNPHDICYWTRPLGGDVINRPRDYYGLGEALPPLPPNQTFEFEDYDPPRQQSYWKEGDWRNYAYDYYRMVEKVDADLGRILDALDERDDETLLFFTSDHGEGLGRHLRIQKWHPFEESVKVPLIVAGAGVSAAGTIDTRHLTTLLDVTATACAAAGVSAPPGSLGRSLLPIARGDEPDSWHESICCDFQITGRVLRSPRYKYIKLYQKRPGRDDGKWFVDADGEPARFDPERIRSYRTEPVRYLFDIEEDPWETRNLAEDGAFAGLVEDHERQLHEEWESRCGFNLHHTIA
jgi:choline-sulfatase